jgi:hypothetical protein
MITGRKPKPTVMKLIRGTYEPNRLIQRNVDPYASGKILFLNVPSADHDKVLRLFVDRIFLIISVYCLKLEA